MDEFKTLRQAVLDGFGKLKRIYGKPLPEYLCWTEPDGSPVAGTRFNSLVFKEGKPALLAEKVNFTIPLDGVPTSRLCELFGYCIAEEEQSLTRALRTANVEDRKALRENRRALLPLFLDFVPYTNPRLAAGRQICESLLALGGPLDGDDLYDDGCGDRLLAQPYVRPEELPYVVVTNAGKKGDKETIRRIGRITWTAEWQEIFVTLCAEDEKDEFFFEVYPHGEVVARPADPSPKRSGADNRYAVEIPTESLQRLERILLNEQFRIDNDRAENRRALREIRMPGTFLFLALKSLLAERGHRLKDGSRVVYFERSSFEYQADIPHVRTWWGGVAAIEEIRLEKDGRIQIDTCCLLGYESSRIYTGFEDEAWDAIFSQAYTEFQNADDPDWEEWLAGFRDRLYDAFPGSVLDAVVKKAVEDAGGVIAFEDGAVPLCNLHGDYLMTVGIADFNSSPDTRVELEEAGIVDGEPYYVIDHNGFPYINEGSLVALSDIICALKLKF